MKKEECMESEECRYLSWIPGPLLDWYDAGARVLPWRENPAPYPVWISEIMLQQTRVEAVKPYFDRFLNALPTIESLAGVPDELLLKLWEGLGYYNRVRNLKKAAQVVMREFGGELPSDPQLLKSLPGIGEYTAGAIASIAYGVAHPVVDGNVLRVLSRILLFEGDIAAPSVKKRFYSWLAPILPKGRAGDFNQSLMELGAMVCLPNGAPKCLSCPVREICRGYLEGTAAALPVKTPKKPRREESRTIFLLIRGERAAIQKRPESGLLAGMWEFPGAPGSLTAKEARKQAEDWGLSVGEVQPLGEAKHIFTHVEWRMTGYALAVRGEGAFTWASEREVREIYSLPFAFKAFQKRLPGLLNQPFS